MRYAKCHGRVKRGGAPLSDDEIHDPMTTLGIIALVFALAGGALVILGILSASPERYALGAFVAGIPLAFYFYMWKVEFIGQLPWVDRQEKARRRWREAREERWTITPTYPASRPPTVPGARGPFQALPLYGPGTCPSCGGTLFYGRLNCPHCSEPVFRDGDATRPPEL